MNVFQMCTKCFICFELYITMVTFNSNIFHKFTCLSSSLILIIRYPSGIFQSWLIVYQIPCNFNCFKLHMKASVSKVIVSNNNIWLTTCNTFFIKTNSLVWRILVLSSLGHSISSILKPLSNECNNFIMYICLLSLF